MYSSFDDFIQQGYSKDLELDMVLLPFFLQDAFCIKMENELEHICKELGLL